MLLDRLLSPLWFSTLLYSTASDLLALQRCSHWCNQSLHNLPTAEQLLRRYLHLSMQQVARLDQSAAVTLKRLLAPLASLERQLSGQSPPRLHRALLIEAVCASNLTVADLAHPHPSPVPTIPHHSTASWLRMPPIWEMFDYCAMPDPRELTLACVGLGRVQLWFHQPFWRRGWSEYLYQWAHSDCGSVDSQQAASERDAICAKLDSRMHWIGCVQPDPTTILAVGYYYGEVRHCTHHVPDTFSRPGYDMRFAYSSTSEAECRRRMKEGRAVDGPFMPVVTFELSGSTETVNGHQLHVYGSLSAFLLCRAAKESDQFVQQVTRYIHRIEGGPAEKDEADGQDEQEASVDKTVMEEPPAALPLYLSCFPMPDSILWNN